MYCNKTNVFVYDLLRLIKLKVMSKELKLYELTKELVYQMTEDTLKMCKVLTSKLRGHT